MVPLVFDQICKAQTYRTSFKMRAVRFHGRQDIRLDEVDEPVCGDGQVKVCQSGRGSRGSFF